MNTYTVTHKDGKNVYTVCASVADAKRAFVHTKQEDTQGRKIYDATSQVFSTHDEAHEHANLRAVEAAYNFKGKITRS